MIRVVYAGFFALVIITCVFLSCKDTVNHQDPADVLKSFCERLAKKDVDGAADLATENSAEVLEMMKYAMQASEEMETKSPNPIDEYQDLSFGKATINGNNASIPVTNTKKNTTITFQLKKEKDGWKVDFGINPKDVKSFDKNMMDSIEKEIAREIDSIQLPAKP